MLSRFSSPLICRTGAAYRSRQYAMCHWVHGCCKSCAADDDDGGSEQPLDRAASATCRQFRVAQPCCVSAAEVDTWNDIHRAWLQPQNIHKLGYRIYNFCTVNLYVTVLTITVSQTLICKKICIQSYNKCSPVFSL